MPWALFMHTAPSPVASVLAAPPSQHALARQDLGMASALAAVAGWLVFLGLRERYGRDPAVRGSGDSDASQSDVPDESPAVVDALRNGGAVRASALGGMLLDLARRGYLTISEHAGDDGRPDWRFERRDTPHGDLRPYENALYTRLFSLRDDATHGGLVHWARTNRQQAQVFLERIERYVAIDLQRRGFVERRRRLPIVTNVVTSGIVGVLGLVAVGHGALIGVLVVASSAGQLVATRTLRRRTRTGSRQASEWSALARRLRNIDQDDGLRDADPPVWERWLVYAAALGVADEFLEGLARRHSPVLAASDFAAWYESESTDGERLRRLGHFAEQFGRALVEAVEGRA